MPKLSLDPPPFVETTDSGLLLLRDNVKLSYDKIQDIVNALDSSNIKDGSISIADLTSVPACHVYNNANQLLTDAIEATVTFNTEVFDTDSMWTAGSPTRVTFTTAGTYLVTFSAELPAVGDYVGMYAYIRKNGVFAPAMFTRGAWTTGALGPVYDLTLVRRFAAADYVEVRAQQDNTANAGRNLTYFDVERNTAISAVRLGA